MEEVNTVTNINSENVDFSMFALFMSADLVVKSVILILIFASFYSWSIIVSKLIRLRKLKQMEKEFDEIFWSGNSFEDLYETLNFNKTDPKSKIFCAAILEWKKSKSQFDQTSDLNSLKELLGYYMNEIHIIMEPKVMEYGSLKMAMIPWINQENYDDTMKFIKNCQADWCGAHLELDGFEMMRGIKNVHGMDHKIFSKFEKVLTGHFHVGSQMDNIHYLGSQMEFFWSDAHDKKYFHVIDTETREIEKVHNPHTLFHKVLYNDEKMDYNNYDVSQCCLLYTSPSPRDRTRSRMPSSA